jgi:type I restriction enzyme, S subunit
MSELPAGWSKASMQDIANIQLGKMLDAAKNKGVPVPYLRNINVRWGSFDLSDVFEMRMTKEEQEIYSIHDGDVLICEGGEPGRAAVWCSGQTNIKFQKALHRARTCTGVAPEFVAFYMQHAATGGELEGRFTGTTIKHFPLGAIRKMPIPVPPSSEQRRIVVKIERLSENSKRARDHVNHIPRLAEKYRQAIMAAAFRGDLTREWRDTNKDKADWRTSTIGDVAAIASGQTPKGIEAVVSSDGDIPWFKVSSMNEVGNLDGLRSSQFRLSRSKADALGLRICEPGSIAFPKRGGAIATNKKRRLLVEGALDLNLMVLTARMVTRDFLWWWMQNLDLSTISNGSNVPQINNGDIAPLVIEVPPTAEQAEISRRIQASVSWIDRLASEATSARRLIDHLDQSILAKAFRGELVPQDPNDEPASALLDRIKTQREAKVSTRPNKSEKVTGKIRDPGSRKR